MSETVAEFYMSVTLTILQTALFVVDTIKSRCEQS